MLPGAKAPKVLDCSDAGAVFTNVHFSARGKYVLFDEKFDTPQGWHVINAHIEEVATQKSIDVLLVVVLGGLGSMSGTIVAAVAWTFLLEGLRIVLPPAVQDWRWVIYPLLLVVFMLVRPGGIFAGTEFRFLKPSTKK